MDYIVVPQLKKVIAWTHKCGGSSIRRQLILDLKDPILIERMKKNNPWTIVQELFVFNPKQDTIPKDYRFEWYVRDPFFRILSCFINRKILIDNDDPDVTFKDFVFNLDYFRKKSPNIMGHTSPQTAGYFEAPWEIIDITKFKFDFIEKMNSTEYSRGYIQNAWNIPSKDLVLNGKTYEQKSFYSKEITDKLRTIYAKDYSVLQDKIELV
jgi:hypothetical protein